MLRWVPPRLLGGASIATLAPRTAFRHSAHWLVTLSGFEVGDVWIAAIRPHRPPSNECRGDLPVSKPAIGLYWTYGSEHAPLEAGGLNDEGRAREYTGPIMGCRALSFAYGFPRRKAGPEP